MLVDRQGSPIEYGKLKLEPDNIQSGTGCLSMRYSMSEMSVPDVKTVLSPNLSINDKKARNRNLCSVDTADGPVWIRVPAGRIDVVEGDTVTLTAAATANPGPITYIWWRGNEEIGGAESRGGALSMGVLKRTHAHNYTVTARSPRGALTSPFFLNVQYGPEGVKAEKRVMVEQGGSVTVLCSALGNPTPNITWTRDAANTSGPAVLSRGVGVARLVVEWASQADTGVYLCHASSTVSTPPAVSTTLIVQQAPWWPNTGPDEVVGGSWAVMGGSGRLECSVRAAPQPTFHWATQDGREIQTGTKYTLEDAQLSDGVVEWRSVMEVHGVTPRDYTHYTCTASNTLGKHSSRLVLTPPVPPATPLHLTVGNVSSDEVWLAWTPNLSKSQPSGYIVRYWRSADTDYQYLNVTGGEVTAVVTEELTPGTRYSFSLQAYNLQGHSRHTSPPLTVTTHGIAESASSSSSSSSSEGGTRSRVPRLILLIMTLAGTALLALNMAIIACFVRRRAAHTARGVSASSSKTTTLEIFSPATTPGGTTQGDDLPLTTTNTTTDLTTLGGQRVECQTGVDDFEQTSLFHGDEEDTPVLSTEGEFLRHTSFRSKSRSQQNGRVLTQNGGHTVQKYRDDSSYYYSPIPQNSYTLVDDVLSKRTTITNPPDVCPTTSDTVGALSCRHQQQQRGTTPTFPTESSQGFFIHHNNIHGAHAVNSSSPSKDTISRHSPGNQSHDSLHNNRQTPQQQAQKPSSPRVAEGKEEPSQQLHHLHSHQQVKQLDPHTHALCDVVATTTGVPGGYATLGPRKHRQTPASFSTLQRSGSSKPITTTAGASQHTSLELQVTPCSQEYQSHQDPVNSRQTRRSSLAQPQLSLGGAGIPSAGIIQEDSGSSGYGGSPRQELSVLGSVSTTTAGSSLNPGVGGSLVTHPTTVALPAHSTTTLTRRRLSQDCLRKGKPELPVLPSRETHCDGMSN
ncbi:uncharacterized protein [Cherax quadricarinatus]